MSGPLTPTTVALLESEGLAECIPVLAGAGLRSIADIHHFGVREADLQAVGVTKLFHQRKLLHLAGERVAAASKGPPSPPAHSPRSRKNTPVRGDDTRHRLGSTPTILERVQRRQRDQEAWQRRPFEGGDHVRVHVVTAKSADGSTAKLRADRKYSVRVGLCDFFVIAKKGTSITTPPADGPVPMFMVEEPDGDGGSSVGIFAPSSPKGLSESHGESLLAVTTYGDGADPTCIRIRTNFHAHCISFELLESRLFGTAVVGALVFPIAYFHDFTADTVLDKWFPVRALNSASAADLSWTAREGALLQDASVVAALRLVLEVPGGCPAQIGKAFHVKHVYMQDRFFRLEIFDTIIFPSTAAAAKHLVRAEAAAATARGETPLSTTGSVADSNVSITLATSPPSDLYFSVRINDKDGTSRRRTKVVSGPTFRPSFNESFVWSREVEHSKCVSLLLKKRGGGLLRRPKTVGVAHIPLQFFLTQNPVEVVERSVALVDVHNPLLTRAAVHVRMSVAPMAMLTRTMPPNSFTIDSIERMPLSRPTAVGYTPMGTADRSAVGGRGLLGSAGRAFLSVDEHEANTTSMPDAGRQSWQGGQFVAAMPQLSLNDSDDGSSDDSTNSFFTSAILGATNGSTGPLPAVPPHPAEGHPESLPPSPAEGRPESVRLSQTSTTRGASVVSMSSSSLSSDPLLSSPIPVGAADDLSSLSPMASRDFAGTDSSESSILLRPVDAAPNPQGRPRRLLLGEADDTDDDLFTRRAS